MSRSIEFSLAVLVLAGCGGSDETVDCDPIAATLVSRIEVTPSTATLADGESVQLTATAYSCDGSRLGESAFTWQSADASTVSVTTTGMAVAVKQGGPVAVTAATQGKQGAATISVAPRAVASVRIEPATANVALGRTSTLVARAFDAQGTELPGRPTVWNSSDPGVVSVSAEGAVTGLALGGPVTITATIDGKPASAQITVVAAAVASITVSPPSASVSPGATVQLQAVLRDDQGGVLDGRAVLWSTSDASRATVSGTGLVTGVLPGGPITIVATSEGRSGSAAITVNPLPLVITTATVPAGTVGSVYTQALAASGGVTPYAWSVSAGALPPGLTLSTAGVLNGTPTSNGSFTFTARVTDAASQSATRSLTLQVGGALTVSTASLPPATTGTPYSSQLVAAGGSPPYTWTLASGALPAGLNLSSAGLISGTPTAAGSSTFIVQAADGSSRTATRALALTVSSSLAITTTTLPGGTTGTSYSQQLSAAGGTTPYSWTVASGSLPAGLGLSSSGVIGGTPTAAGSSTFTVQVTDAASRSATQSLTLVVSSSLTLGTTTLPGGTVGASYSQQLSATGGTQPYTWSVTTGTLPDGLALSPSGLLSGIPTAAGSSTFTVRVADAGSGSATREFTLAIASPLGISTTTLPGATSGVAYSQSLAATGGTAPYTWTIASGTPPPGLSLSATGILSGTPTTAGDYIFTVQAADAASRTATQSLGVTVAAGAASQISWMRQPANVRRNEPITPGPIVRVQDGAGNLVTTPIAVTMSITRPSNASFTGSSITTVTTVGGTATFENLRIDDRSNSTRITASAGSIRSPESENFRVQ